MTPEPSTLCLGCWQNLNLPVVLRGPLSLPYRVFGLKPSRMNPNTCTLCEMAFSRVMKARAVTIDATVMFADLRGYTTLTQTIGQAALGSLLDAFYDDCAASIWHYERFAARRQDLLRDIGTPDVDLGIGIGIDSGATNFGEFGHSHRDLTAVGTVVNRAARVQAMAKSGEILVTSTVRDRSGGMVTGAGQEFALKGFEQPVMLFAA